MFTAAQGGSAKSAVLPYPQAPDLAPSFANTGTASTENQVSKLFLGVGLVRNLDTNNFKTASIRLANWDPNTGELGLCLITVHGTLSQKQGSLLRQKMLASSTSMAVSVHKGVASTSLYYMKKSSPVSLVIHNLLSITCAARVQIHLEFDITCPRNYGRSYLHPSTIYLVFARRSALSPVS